MAALVKNGWLVSIKALDALTSRIHPEPFSNSTNKTTGLRVAVRFSLNSRLFTKYASIMRIRQEISHSPKDIFFYIFGYIFWLSIYPKNNQLALNKFVLS